jgi:hypothetical protein
MPAVLPAAERLLAGMLTRKPVRLIDTSDTIREHLFDADHRGNDLNVWTVRNRPRRCSLRPCRRAR